MELRLPTFYVLNISLPNPSSWRHLPMLSFRSFIVLAFKFTYPFVAALVTETLLSLLNHLGFLSLYIIFGLIHWSFYSQKWLYWSDYYCFILRFEFKQLISSFFFKSVFFSIQIPLYFHINFRNNFQNHVRILIQIALNLQINLGINKSSKIDFSNS